MADSGTEYKLGGLMEFKGSVSRRLDSIEKKVDNLNVWRWKVAGMTSLLSILGHLLTTLIKRIVI